MDVVACIVVFLRGYNPYTVPDLPNLANAVLRPASKWPMRSAVAAAMLALSLPHSLPLSAVTQHAGVLRITVVLADADGNVTPIPRVVLLVSDNPATSEPRRVRTGADGAVEITLRPGSYTVESDAPVTLGTQSYVWTQTIDVTRGSNALSLTPANAEINTDTVGASRRRSAHPRRFRRHLHQMAP